MIEAALLEKLKTYDTPTICNAMEVVAPERRLIGYTTKPLVCPFPDLPPIVGYARTVSIRSVIKSGLPPAEQARRRIDGEPGPQQRRKRDRSSAKPDPGRARAPSIDAGNEAEQAGKGDADTDAREDVP